MAKKQQSEEREQRRLSRKEVLLERRRRERTRQVRIVVGLIVGLLVLVFLLALVMEGFVRPNQPVAEVNGEKIGLAEWQDRVRFQRAQFIIAMEEQYASFGGDIGLIQQFNQQQISLLQQPDLLGELVLEQMVNEELIRQEAEAQGIEVTDAEVDTRIAESFNYFGGGLPTPFPTPTQTAMPTPSLTPFPTAVLTEVLPTAIPFPTPTAGPTSTPGPTATPVSEAAYREELKSILDRYRAMGVDEATYRSAVRAQLLRDELADALAEEAELSPTAEHASLYVLTFDTEEDAEQAAAEITDAGFLDVWNRIRSLPPDDEAALNGTATEALWQTEERLAQRFGSEVAESAFEVDIGEPSAIITATLGDPAIDVAVETIYYIIMVSGREERELPESALDTQKQGLVSELLQERREIADVEILATWQGRAPKQPVLDTLFLQPPTPAPSFPEATPGLIVP